MTTIADVARVAGVSVATVSRALRGLERVNPETRDRVLRVARELNYVASPTAASLASGRTKVVGVVAPFLTRWFFSQLVSSIEKTLRDRGHHVLLFDLESERYDTRRPLTREMLWRRVDGIITLNLPVRAEELGVLSMLGLPVVAVGNPVAGWPCVGIDDRLAMRTAVRHVLDLGHRDIGYVGAVPEGAAHVLTPLDRLETFFAVLAEEGIRTRAAWVRNADWSAAGAAAQVAPVLRGAERPTAVVAASDEMAIGVMAEARRAGLRVPADVSVIGIDDFTLSGVLDLTTVRQDVTGQGRAAAELLLSAVLEGADISVTRPARASGTGTARAGSHVSDVLLPTELVVRASTAPPPGQSPGSRLTLSGSSM